MVTDLEYNPEHFPTVVVNDGSVENLEQAKQFVANNVDALKKELGSTGAILFRGFPITDAESYDAFFSSFGYPNFTYKESLSNAVRINHTEYVFTANEAPKDVEIYLHNEMAQTPIYPNIISLFCEAAADQGGATVVCRSDNMYTELMKNAPEMTEKLEKVGVKYTTVMPYDDSPESGQGRSWRGTLGVETKEQAEEKLSSLGYSWVWNDDQSLAAQTGALPAIKTLEGGRKVFFNQIIAAYMGWKGVRENPSVALCFGDGSDFTKDYLDEIVAASRKLSYDIEWQDGDVAIVDNHLAMHGRMPYSGDRKRKVLVVLGR
ncbi:SyrP protein [Pseudomaricurvus alkylphenolicus]|jgi:alpha-ketoglutarate-dependent taurine dioxygenase|nr:TauD/TfdA family dioxygenase [Pseudomaricurvus alkylphenolicus]NIB40467.1 SyrP protein [Pseudomaricurvus alkylphenolicus]